VTPADFTEILKLNGWRALFIGIASLGLIAASEMKFLPDLGSWWIVFAIVGFLALAGAAASCAEWASKNYTERKDEKKAQAGKAKRLEDHRQQFIRDIPRFEKIERDIFGYLRVHNQNTFTASMDGDLAAGLLGRGYVRLAVLPGQHVDVLATPFIVPEHIWDIVVARSEDFPYEASDRGFGRERMPWHPPF
jgi:hypothetical protein